jgi:HEAT repeat protein
MRWSDHNMKNGRVIWTMALLLAGSGWAAAADAGALTDDEAFTRAAAWKKGESRAAWIAVEEKVRDAKGDAARRKDLAKRLVAVLKAEASVEAKDYAIREIRVVGGADEVPAVAALLTDKALSHMARYALQSWREIPAAADAIRDALGKVEGDLRLGMLESLGEIRDAKAVPSIASLLDGKDAALVEAAAAALGKIAAPECPAALRAAREKADATNKALITDALLKCAERLVADGKADAASPVYEELVKAGEPPHVRVAALRGLSLAKGDGGAAFLVQQLSGGDPGLQPHAAHFLMRLPEETVAKGVAAELAKASTPGARVALLAVLEGKRATAARDAALAQLKGDSADVQKAALRVLAGAGTDGEVPALVGMMKSSDASVAEQAEKSLAGLGANGVNAAIRVAMGGADAAMKARLIRVLGVRKAADAVDALVAAARDADSTVRGAAYVAIGQVGDAGALPNLAALLASPQAEGDRADAEKALLAICDRESNCQAQVPVMIGAVQKAPVAARFVVYRLAAKLGGAAALEAVRGALKDPEPAIREAAAKALAQWADASAADDLLALLQAATDKEQKAVLLAGIVRMTGLADERTPAQRLALCRAAMSASETPEQKRLALATFAPVKTLEALNIVLPYLGDPSLVEAAAPAVVAIAAGLTGAWPAEAEAAMRKAQAATKTKAVHDTSNAAIYAMQNLKGFIVHWLVSEPYADGGKDCTQLYDTIFPPEQDPAKAKWKAVEGSDSTVNFNKFMPGDNRVAYLKTNIWVAQETDVRLEMGSDDGIKVWINGKTVHGNNAVRGMQPGQDKADAKLAKGWNVLLVKITQGGGDWSASVKLVGRDGKPLAGVRVNPWETPEIK